MAFRADEAVSNGYDRARGYLVSRTFTPAERERSEKALLDIIEECGGREGYRPGIRWFRTMTSGILRPTRAIAAAIRASIIRSISRTGFSPAPMSMDRKSSNPRMACRIIRGPRLGPKCSMCRSTIRGPSQFWFAANGRPPSSRGIWSRNRWPSR